MKTPIIKLIDYIECKEVLSENEKTILREAYLLLEDEKEELKQAYIAGTWDTSGLDSDEAFEEYFNETFN